MCCASGSHRSKIYAKAYGQIFPKEVVSVITKEQGRKGQKKYAQDVLRNFVETGIDTAPDSVMLETLLLCVLNPSKSREASRLLLNNFLSLSGVINAPFPALCDMDGIDVDTAVFIRTIFLTMRSYYSSEHSASTKITDTTSAKEFMRNKFIGLTLEAFYLAGIGIKGKVLFCKKIARGTPDRVDISFRELIRASLLADAFKVVIAHNHPGGLCIPSRLDIHTTHILNRNFMQHSIELFDHIIVGEDGVHSMREQDILP